MMSVYVCMYEHIYVCITITKHFIDNLRKYKKLNDNEAECFIKK